MRTPPTHYYIESSGWVALKETQPKHPPPYLKTTMKTLIILQVSVNAELVLKFSTICHFGTWNDEMQAWIQENIFRHG